MIATSEPVNEPIRIPRAAPVPRFDGEGLPLSAAAASQPSIDMDHGAVAPPREAANAVALFAVLLCASAAIFSGALVFLLP